MRLTARSAIATLVIGGWATLYVFLLVTDRTFLYLSPRTAWLVPVGGAILVFALIGRLLSVRDRDRVSSGDAVGFALVGIPVVVVLALPPASLDSFAAGRRSSFASAAFVPNVDDIASGDLSLADIAGAVRSEEAMAALSARAGAEVSFIGFVARDRTMPADEFLLTRFMISCCVADALSVQVRVVAAPPGRFVNDDWVRVTGSLYPLENEVVIDASEVVPVAKPEHPYLNP
jgi:putative membrane protein